MRRTSRLVLLLGIFLAALTFVVVLFLGRATPNAAAQRPQPARPRQLPTVVAAADIPLGTVVTQDMVTTTDHRGDRRARRTPSATRPRRSARRPARPSSRAPRSTHATSRTAPSSWQFPRASAPSPIQVNELTGVGNLVDVGDNVDLADQPPRRRLPGRSRCSADGSSHGRLGHQPAERQAAAAAPGRPDHRRHRRRRHRAAPAAGRPAPAPARRPR